VNKTNFVLSIIVAFVIGSVFTGVVFGADGVTHLQKTCAKAPKNPDNIKPECELLNMIESISLTPGPQGIPGPAGPIGLTGPQGSTGATGSGDTMYISENITCESQEVGPTLFQLCTNTCDEGDEAVNVSTPGTEVQLDDFRPTGYRTVTFDVPPSFFKVLCIDWRD